MQAALAANLHIVSNEMCGSAWFILRQVALATNCPMSSGDGCAANEKTAGRSASGKWQVATEAGAGGKDKEQFDAAT